ncbi:hypothetical protein D0T92_08585 [Neisseria zalophi]|uniref:Uncharacterized protein n=2 Tax=Neisseria zalophi TaxID=640030 RepID=A0A5J6PV38_9NEIS|nr:hypothetical protein D0T92_08585 [Neisseria zalophi]
MEREKIYYTVVVLVAAVSVLLSPFFYIRSGQRNKLKNQPRNWRKIMAANILTALILLAVWWFGWRNLF